MRTACVRPKVPRHSARINNQFLIIIVVVVVVVVIKQNWRIR